MSKGLRASIFTDDYRTTREATAPGMHENSCTAFGRVKGVTLVGKEFPDSPFEPSAEYPAAKLVRRIIGGNVVFHICPVNPPPGFLGSPMHGGAYVNTSDSRFSKAIGGMYAAIALHDRYER